jgi:hypothetical protein
MTKSERKITFIGAGSTVFAKNLIGDILSFPELADSTICLYDIEENRLKSSEIVAKRIAATLGVPSKIEVTTDRDLRHQYDSGGRLPTLHDYRLRDSQTLWLAPDDC